MTDRIKLVPDPAMPRDMILVVQYGRVVGGLRVDDDEPKGAVIYDPAEARGMAELLNLTDAMRRHGA